MYYNKKYYEDVFSDLIAVRDYYPFTQTIAYPFSNPPGIPTDQSSSIYWPAAVFHDSFFAPARAAVPNPRTRADDSKAASGRRL